MAPLDRAALLVLRVSHEFPALVHLQCSAGGGADARVQPESAGSRHRLLDWPAHTVLGTYQPRRPNRPAEMSRHHAVLPSRASCDRAPPDEFWHDLQPLGPAVRPL